MKLLNASLVFVTLLVVGHVQCRVASCSGNSVFPPNENEVPSRCPHDDTTNTTAGLEFLVKKLKTCIAPSPAFKHRVATAAVTIRYQQVFQSACAQVPAARVCMDEVAAEAALCLNKMEMKVIKMTRENVEVGISATCDDGSDNIARVFGVDIKALSNQNKMKALLCLRRVLPDAHLKADDDLPTFTIRKYRVAKEAHECVINIAQEEQVTTTNFEKFFNKFIGGMKCISPVTAEIVLCTTLE